jgi:hypothetical protein
MTEPNTQQVYDGAMPDGAIMVDGECIDALGNPMVKVDGCPNCGAGAGWATIIQYAAAGNSGRDLDGACSRRCALQLEHAARLAAS